jgi:hypothetical protein
MSLRMCARWLRVTPPTDGEEAADEPAARAVGSDREDRVVDLRERQVRAWRLRS